MNVIDVIMCHAKETNHKDHLHCLYGECLLSRNCPLVRDALLGEWIKKKREGISSESIVHGFKKCCMSNSTDKTEGDRHPIGGRWQHRQLSE
jgi:hypothetical protein